MGGRIGNTLILMTSALLLSLIIAFPIGIISAIRQYSRLDYAVTTFSFFGLSMPSFWLGLMLIIIFAGVLPTGGMTNEFLLNPGFWQHLRDLGSHILLPSLTLGLTLYGEYTLIVRSAMLETLGEDYILTARAKGLKPWAIVRKHALRNAALPITTLIALSLGYIVAGAILIETVFSWPGIGRAVYEAVLERDYPMLQGAFLLLTIAVVLCNLIADLLYFKLDPRVTT
jgi:peptide/nickel transport system permease protein